MGQTSELPPSSRERVSQKDTLEPSCTELEYFSYLEKITGINPQNPWPEEALNRGVPEKAVAHTMLAYQHLTERESHLLPLTDMESITKHALYWYSQNEIPWFDLVASDHNDFVKKSSKNKSSANTNSAPLIRDCNTFDEFLERVVPQILNLRSLDPNAMIKIFPQSKNVETFNLGVRTDEKGSTQFVVEMYAGAYTPRAGEDGKNTVVKLKNVSKEARIVRVTIQLDECGNTTVFLKPPVEFNENGQTIQHPLSKPEGKIDWRGLFESAVITNNHDTMTSSGNPFYLLANLLKNPSFTEMLRKFEKVHSQLGFVDLVMSGMIGPDTVFGIDIDFDTSSNYSNAAEYISKKRGTFQPHFPIDQVFTKIVRAEIFDERDNHILNEIKYLYVILHEMFEKMESTNMIWLTGFNKLMTLIDMNMQTRIHTPWLKQFNTQLDTRDEKIISSINSSLKDWSKSTTNKPSDESTLYTKASGRPTLVSTKKPYLSPKETDVRRIKNKLNSTPYVINSLTVAEII